MSFLSRKKPEIPPEDLMAETYNALLNSKDEKKQSREIVTKGDRFRGKMESLRTFRGYLVKEVIHVDMRGQVFLVPCLESNGIIYYIAEQVHMKNVRDVCPIKYPGSDTVYGYFCHTLLPTTIDPVVTSDVPSHVVQEFQDFERSKKILVKDFTSFNLLSLGTSQLLIVAVVFLLGCVVGMGPGGTILFVIFELLLRGG